MAELTEAGCIGFSQADVAIKDTLVLHRALQYAATFGYAVWLRPSDAWLGDGVAAKGAARDAHSGLSGVPVIAETIALATIFELVRDTGARVHLCRLSSAAGIELVRRAKADGLPVTLRRQRPPPAPDRHRHRLLRRRHAPDAAAAPATRPRCDPRRARRRHHRRSGQRPHAGRRRRQEPALRRGRARRHRPRAAARAWRCTGARRRRCPGRDAGPRHLAPARVLARAVRRRARGRHRPARRRRRRPICACSTPRRAGRSTPQAAEEPGPRTRRSPATTCPAACAARWSPAPSPTRAAEPARSPGMRRLRAVLRLARAVGHGAARCTGASCCSVFPSLDSAARHELHRLVVRRADPPAGHRAARSKARASPAPASSWPTTSRGSTSWSIQAVLPDTRFVAKADVRSLAASLPAGRLRPERSYLERERKRDALRVVHRIAEALRGGDDGRGVPGRHDRRPAMPCCRSTPTCCRPRSPTATPVQPVAIRFSDATRRRQRGGGVRRHDLAGRAACGASACGEGVVARRAAAAAARRRGHRAAPARRRAARRHRRRARGRPSAVGVRSPRGGGERRPPGRPEARSRPPPWAATAAAALAAASASPR